MYHPLTRVLTILHMLKANPSLTGEQMASELQVDVRTVRRYITMLRDLGVTIDSEAGICGGYRLPSRHPLPPTIFTREELEAMRQGLETIDDQAAASASAKINMLLVEFL